MAETAPNLFDQASAEYPILKDQNIQYKEDFGRGQGFLESWPPGETGSPDLPRPTEFDSDKFGVEVYDKTTRPIDILGDVVSHKMINDDPTIKGHYNDFVSSLEPWQHDVMKDQYLHAQEAYGEKRDFKSWRDTSGLPAYFRGHAFQQWDNSEKYYTKEQLNRFDDMMKYLKKK